MEKEKVAVFEGCRRMRYSKVVEGCAVRRVGLLPAEWTVQIWHSVMTDGEIVGTLAFMEKAPPQLLLTM